LPETYQNDREFIACLPRKHDWACFWIITVIYTEKKQLRVVLEELQQKPLLYQYCPFLYWDTSFDLHWRVIMSSNKQEQEKTGFHWICLQAAHLMPGKMFQFSENQGSMEKVHWLSPWYCVSEELFFALC
jgi:hypothetical protein